ncbi:MAG: hypothetical protein J0M04_23470 [Verrucomicrobia bacterium]|nr:hypothetical protein [Verrucomicrobiota bacterium]
MNLKPCILTAATATISVSAVQAATVIYSDDFNDQQNIFSGGPYTQTLAGSAPTIRNAVLGGSASAVWGSGAEVGGWGQRDYGDSNEATPTSSNFLTFTPVSGYDYTVTMTVDTTALGGAGAGGWGESWLTVGFTSSQHNWNGADSGTIDTADLVRFKSNTIATITYTRSGADLLAAGVNYVGWVTDWPGLVNMNSVNQVSVDNFSLTAVPEPGAAVLGGLGMLALLRRRR